MSRELVEDVLGVDMARELWSLNYDKALPVTLQNVDLSAVLPAVFYMFRWGRRRGKGRFVETFASPGLDGREQRRSVTIENVAAALASTDLVSGFAGDVQQAILGDLLLCHCLENVNNDLGRNRQIQRVAPTHYMASWIDLPDSAAHLRYVPEMVVALLADQEGEVVTNTVDGQRTRFAVGKDFQDNLLLQVFNSGIEVQRQVADRTSDRFDEVTPVGIDQLLTIRLAQHLGEAPDKLRGRGGDMISNQRPVAERATSDFSSDLRRFVRAYSQVVPRKTFVPMIESCFGIGLLTILTTSFDMLVRWADTGVLPTRVEETAGPVIIDCSNGINPHLRGLSEQSCDDLLRRMEKLPTVLTALQILDYCAAHDPQIRALNVKTRPSAREWIDLLGEIVEGRHARSEPILYLLEQKAMAIADKIRDDNAEIAEVLEGLSVQPNPVWRLSEALRLMMSRTTLYGNLLKFFDSCVLVDRPNGLGVKRKTQRTDPFTGRRSLREVRSLRMSDTVLEYLVHVHLLHSGNGDGPRVLSLGEFLGRLRERHGFYVDEAPPSVSVSNELLQQNRAALERRLRDLGLLAGVNDAEAMKRLVHRFEPRRAGHDTD